MGRPLWAIRSKIVVEMALDDTDSARTALEPAMEEEYARTLRLHNEKEKADKLFDEELRQHSASGPAQS